MNGDTAPNEPKQNPFRDTLIDRDASQTPPLVTLEELVAAETLMEAATPMLEDSNSLGVTKIPEVRIPKEIWQKL